MSNNNSIIAHTHSLNKLATTKHTDDGEEEAQAEKPS